MENLVPASQEIARETLEIPYSTLILMIWSSRLRAWMFGVSFQEENTKGGWSGRLDDRRRLTFFQFAHGRKWDQDARLPPINISES